MTKLRSGFVLPSHTSSVQPAVHISHTHTWAFCLKLLADLETQSSPQHTHTHTMIDAKTHTKAQVHTSNWCLLGFGDHQEVTEQEEVPVLGLHACLQLGVSVEEEEPFRAGQKGLDQRTGFWTSRNQETLSGSKTDRKR